MQPALGRIYQQQCLGQAEKSSKPMPENCHYQSQGERLNEQNCQARRPSGHHSPGLGLSFPEQCPVQVLPGRAKLSCKPVSPQPSVAVAIYSPAGQLPA